MENKIHVHDFQATVLPVLHLLGIDHERLTYKFQGRHYRLADVHGNVVKPVLAQVDGKRAPRTPASR
ncbi:MAG: DUF1501 domain-containing protein [Verrucomicrobia bacterium]|nr:DUF1501 domain-containing protein [Verrucomicrobiota bacterium]